MINKLHLHEKSVGGILPLLVVFCGVAVALLNNPGPELHVAPSPSVWQLMLRLSLAPVLLLFVYGVGGGVLSRMLPDDVREMPVALVLFAGFLAVTVTVFMLSLFSLYRQDVMLGLFALTSIMVRRWQYELLMRSVVAVRQETSSWSGMPFPQKLVRWCAWFAFLAVFAFVVLFKVVYPDFGGDIFYYLRHYQYAREHASTISSVFDTWVYFPAKASGLHSFCAVAFGDASLQVASLVYYVFFCCVAMSLISLVTADVLWGILVVVASSLTFEMVVFTNNFSKTNFFGALHQYFLLYVLLWISRRRKVDAGSVVLVLYGVSAAFFTIQNVVFSLLVLGIAAWTLKSAWDVLKRPCVLCATSLIVSMMVLCAVNLILVGFFDISTIPLQMRMGLDMAGEYVPCQVRFKVLEMGLMPAGPSGVALYFRHVWELLSSSGFLGSRFVDVAWIGLAAAFVFPAVPGERDSSPRFMFSFLLTILSAFVLYVFVVAVFPEEYNRKHSIFMFGIFFKVVLYITSFFLASRTILPWIAKRAHFSPRMSSLFMACFCGVVLLVVTMTSVSGLPYNYKDDLRERMDFARGKVSAKQVYEQYYPEVVIADLAMRYLRENGLTGRVWPLAQESAAYGYSQGLFASQYDPELQPHLREIFYSPPQVATGSMLRNGVPFVVLDLKDALRYLSLAPVFSPESLLSNFRVLARLGDSAWLLTADKSLGVPVDQELIRQYESYLGARRTEFEVRAYDALGAFLDKCQKIQ